MRQIVQIFLRGLMATPLRGQTSDLLKKGVQNIKGSRPINAIISRSRGDVDSKGKAEVEENTYVHQIGEVEITDESKKGLKFC